MSMISEQVADLREKAQIFENSGCATDGIVKTFRKAADTIEELSAKLAINSQPPADQWIPCSRELPPLDEEVLIHCEKDHYNVAYYDGSDFRAFDCLYDVEDVVAWKEFERYKGVE